MSDDGDYALGAWIAARDTANRNAAMYDQAVANLMEANRNVDILNVQVAQQNIQIAELRARIADMAVQMAVLEAGSAGMRAQLGMFKQAHPNSPALADSGRRYQDGEIKSVSRLAYEAAFDAKAKDLGISNPEQHRAD